MIPQNIIDQILNETDIIQVIDEYVPLKKTGANFKACCPFHNEKSPSFVVSPQKQIYHCFGCGVGGNVLSFVMNYEKLTFPASVEILAERLNIEIPKDHRQKQKDEGLERFFKINSYAQWFFSEQLKSSPGTLQYIQSRGLSASIVETYQLGFAPDEYQKLTPFLKSKNVPMDLAQSLGLIKKRDSGGFYDFYRNRLTFPIRNNRGHIIGFGGRTLGDAQAKYINSPESPVYNKSRELYGLFEARKEISHRDQVVIVEGYIDVLACAQLDIPHAVAPLGTSLTTDQVKILNRYSTDLVLMFDGDSAGKKAAVKAMQTCFAQGIHPRVCLLPDGRDPGDYLKNANNSKELKDLLEKATSAMDWLFAEYLNSATAEPTSRAKVVRNIIKWLESLPDPIERGEYYKKLSQYFEIPVSELQKNLENTNDLNIVRGSKIEELSLEARLIFYYLQTPQEFPERDISKFACDFKDLGLKKLAELVQVFVKKHETFQPQHAISDLPQELQGLLRHILFKGSELGEETGISQSMFKFKRQVAKKRLKEITAQILKAEALKDNELKMQLLKQKQELLSQTH